MNCLPGITAFAVSSRHGPLPARRVLYQTLTAEKLPERVPQSQLVRDRSVNRRRPLYSEASPMHVSLLGDYALVPLAHYFTGSVTRSANFTFGFLGMGILCQVGRARG